MARKKNNFDTKAILTDVYPKIATVMAKREPQWKHNIGLFVQQRNDQLFDSCPCDRIYYNDEDKGLFFNSITLTEGDIIEGIRNAYFYQIAKFKPKQAKDPLSVACLCIIRYFFLKKNQKDLDLALIYLSFTGMFYPSIHYGSFPEVAPNKYRYVMEYVVNKKLTMKYDLKRQGSVFGAVRSIANTWIKTYEKEMKDFDDENIAYLIQQLHHRIKSFMINIAKLYYDAYQNKEYISYDKDSVPEEEGGKGSYHLADSDTFKLQIIVDKTMNKINTNKVDYKICAMVADANCRTDTVRALFETLFSNPDNMPKIKEFVTLLVATYMRDTGNNDVVNAEFYKFAISARPHTEDKDLNRMKDLVDEILDDNSADYRRRKKRYATKQSFQKAFYKYFGILIINANK